MLGICSCCLWPITDSPSYIPDGFHGAVSSTPTKKTKAMHPCLEKYVFLPLSLYQNPGSSLDAGLTEEFTLSVLLHWGGSRYGEDHQPGQI